MFSEQDILAIQTNCPILQRPGNDLDRNKTHVGRTPRLTQFIVPEA